MDGLALIPRLRISEPRATLDLLEQLVTHPEVRNLLLLGACGGTEVGLAVVHTPLMRTLEASKCVS